MIKTKKDLVDFWTFLNAYGSSAGYQKFQYFIGRNLSLIEPVVKLLGKLEESKLDKEKLDKLDEFRKKTKGINEKHALRDSKGTIIRDKNQNIILDPEKIDDGNKEFDKLKIEYKDILAEREKEIEEFQKLLEEDIDSKIEFRKIKADDLHPDVISADVAYLINNDLVTE
jgi:hypothetical protein